MNTTTRTAIKEVLDAYFEPDSPEALAAAMYHLRRVFRNSTPLPKRTSTKKPTTRPRP